jgi:hypothetical protein
VAPQELKDPSNPSTNFHFYFDDAGIRAGDQLLADYARTVLATVEADFGRLSGLFGTGARFGSSNRIQVIIDANLGLGPGGALAQNNGFHSDGTSTIWIAAGSGVFPPYLSRGQLDEVLRMAFVAELTEVFLSLRSEYKPTLNPGYSDGEALSRVFATWFHPVGYAAAGRTVFQLSGPLFSASHWLNETQAPRSDYVHNPSEQDGLPGANGCGILYLYYLHTQLRHSWSDIVDALGLNLADTYENLGLGASADAFSRFESLLRTAFPLPTDPQTSGYDLPFEDVFPLLDPKRCAVDLDVGPPGGALADAEPLKDEWVDIRPFPLCPVGHYHYEIVPADATVEVTATTRGYAQPAFSWRVEGEPVTGDEYTPTPLSFTAAGWNDDPYHPWKSIPATAVVNGSGYLTHPGWHTSKLTVGIRADPATPARVATIVEVDVVERSGAGIAISQSGWADINTTLLQWDPPFDEDRKRCADRLRDLMRRYTHLREIILLRTLPDPPPSLVTRGLEIAARLDHELGVLDREDPDLTAALRERFGFTEST